MNQVCPPLELTEDNCQSAQGLQGPQELSVPGPQFTWECSPQFDVNCLECIPIEVDDADVTILECGAQPYLHIASGCQEDEDGCETLTLDFELGIPDNSAVAGCGIDIEDCVISVNPQEVAGVGLVEGDGECDIDVNYGCGLTIEGDELVVDPEDIAGLGLAPGSGDCSIDVQTGCGLTILDNEVAVDNEDLAGAGLKTAGVCALAVDYGCGLTLSGNALIVKNTDLAGPGLSPYGTCGLTATGVQVTPGCGLQVVGGVWSIKRSDIIGLGLKPGGGDCSIDVYPGCGLTYDEVGRVIVNNEDLAGDGLHIQDGEGECGLEIHPGCGIIINDEEQIAINAIELIGDGLGFTGDPGDCKLNVIPGDCLKIDGLGKVALDLTVASTTNVKWVSETTLSVDGGCLKLSVKTEFWHINYNACGIVTEYAKDSDSTVTSCICVADGSVTGS